MAASSTFTKWLPSGCAHPQIRLHVYTRSDTCLCLIPHRATPFPTVTADASTVRCCVVSATDCNDKPRPAEGGRAVLQLITCPAQPESKHPSIH